MFESVVFPAPFSPSSACTSPAAASKSTRSFASTPGKRLLMPRIATAGTGEAPVVPAPPTRSSLESGELALLALRAADRALDEPVDRVQLLDRQPLALLDPQLSGLVVERARELVERALDERLLLLGDRRLGLRRDLRPVRSEAHEFVLQAAVVEARLPGSVHRGLNAGDVVDAPVVGRRCQPGRRRELLRVRVVAHPGDALRLGVLTRRGAVHVLADHVGSGRNEALCGLPLFLRIEPRCVQTRRTLVLGRIAWAPSTNAFACRITSGIGNGAMKPIVPFFVAAPAAIPDR